MRIRLATALPGPVAAFQSLAGAARRSSPAVSGALLMIGAMAIFGAMGILARAASRSIGPAQLASIRFAVGALAVVAMAWSGHATLRVNNLRLLTLRGLFGGVAVLLYFVAIERCGDAGTATLLNYTSPIFTALFAWFFLGEKPAPRLALGVIVAAVGVTLVLERPGLGLRLGVGELAGIASAVVSGFAVTTIRAARAHDNAATIFLAFCVGGLVICLPFALPEWRGADLTTWGLALAVGVTSLVAQLMMTHAFGLVPATRGALFQQLTPVFVFALGAAVLGEPLTASAVGGAALTLAAIAFAAGR